MRRNVYRFDDGDLSYGSLLVPGSYEALRRAAYFMGKAFTLVHTGLEDLPNVKVYDDSDVLVGIQYIRANVEDPQVATRRLVAALVALDEVADRKRRRGPLDGAGVGSIAHAKVSKVSLYHRALNEWVVINDTTNDPDDFFTTEEVVITYGGQLSVPYLIPFES